MHHIAFEPCIVCNQPEILPQELDQHRPTFYELQHGLARYACEVQAHLETHLGTHCSVDMSSWGMSAAHMAF